MTILESARRAALKEQEERKNGNINATTKTDTTTKKTSILESAYKAAAKENPEKYGERTTPTRSSPASDLISRTLNNMTQTNDENSGGVFSLEGQKKLVGGTLENWASGVALKPIQMHDNRVELVNSQEYDSNTYNEYVKMLSDYPKNNSSGISLSDEEIKTVALVAAKAKKGAPVGENYAIEFFPESSNIYNNLTQIANNSKYLHNPNVAKDAQDAIDTAWESVLKSSYGLAKQFKGIEAAHSDTVDASVKSAQKINDVLENSGTVGKFVGGIESAIIGQAADTVSTAGVGRLGLAPLFMRVSGNAYAEKVNEGWTEEQAQNFGDMQGAKEVLTELISGVAIFGGKNYGTGKTSLDDAIESGISKAVSKLIRRPEVVKTVSGAVSGGVGEGLEEIISKAFDPITEAIASKNTAPLKDYLSSDFYADMAYSGLSGFAMGFMGLPFEAISSKINGNNYKNQMRKAGYDGTDFEKAYAELKQSYGNSVSREDAFELWSYGRGNAKNEERTNTETDSLEKAAMDAVANRNESKTEPVTPEATTEELVNILKGALAEETAVTEDNTVHLRTSNNTAETQNLNDILYDVARDKLSNDTTNQTSENVQNSADLQKDNVIPAPKENTQKTPLEVAEAKANEAAFEAGRQNVPRDKVSLETPEQEEAYNNGRLEHIKNMNSDNSSQNNVDKSPKSGYNVSGNYTSPEYETPETRKPIVPTDFQADNKRRAEAAKQYGLNSDEASRLTHYVGGQFCYMLNTRLMGDTLTDGDSRIIDSICNALLKMPEYSGRTYRNLQFDTEQEYNNFLSEYSEGNMVEFKAFTSASKLPNGYTKFGNGVVHLVIDGVSGRDIADTFGVPRQQEVVYLPGTTIEIKKVTIANDGNTLIFAQEINTNENIRTKETGNIVNNRPETGIHQNINGRGTEPIRNGTNNNGVQREVQGGDGRDGILSERRKSVETGNVQSSLEEINEVKSDEQIRANQAGSTGNNRPASSTHQDLDEHRTGSGRNGTNSYSVSGKVQSGHRRDGILSERGKSADAGSVLGEYEGINEVNSEAKEISENGRVQIHPEERSNILQQVQAERALHGSMYKISERDTGRSADTENTVQGVRTDKEIENAVESTLKQEIISNAELMKMLQEKFGGDVIYAISSEVMSAFEKNGNLGKFEALFIDGGEKIYNALKNSSQDSDYLQEDFSDERKGSILSIGSGERSYSASTRKQTKRVDGRTSRYREGRTAARERKKYCQTLKASGSTRQEVVHGHKCEVIPKEHYTPRMTKIYESNKKDGFDETVFITGKATIPFVTDTNGKPKTARGAFLEVNGKKIAIVQYDDEFYMPEQINDHEKIHNRRGTPLLEKAKNIIMNSLSVAEKNRVLEKLSKDYNGIIQGNEEAIMEEFVANVLSDMDTEYVNKFEDIRKAYWKGDEAFIDNYKVSEYAESIEAGGANSKALNNIGLGNENELSSPNGLYLAPDEYAVIAKAIMAKNAGLSDNELKPFDFVYSANNLYVYRNHSLGEFTAISKFDLVVDKEILPIIKEAVKNGSYRNGQTFNNWSGGVWSDRGGNNSNPKWVENSGAAIYDGGLPVGTRRGNDVGYSRGDGSDPSGNNVKYSVDSNETYIDKLTSQPDNKTFGQNINVSSEDDAKFWDEWFNKAKEYGAIPSGENPHREVSVPRKTEKDKKVSQTVRTILEAKATPDEAVPSIEKLVEDGVFSYDVYTDKKAINDAEAYIQECGWVEGLKDWFNAVEKGEVSKQITAMGWALYNNAASTAANTSSKTEKDTATRTALDILDAMVRHQRSAAQALQATRILKKLSPETQLYGVQKSVQALQRELRERYAHKAPDLEIDEKLAEDFLKAQTQEEREAIEREIYKSIGRQIPSRFIDKWNAWRYLAMLGNLRTHIRNIAGNAGFAPVVFVKNLTATGIESIVHRVSGKRTVRSKAILVNRRLLKAAWDDYAIVSDLISNGGKYNDSAMANQYIEEGRKIFNFKPLEWARKANSSLLEKEDMWFSRPHYAYALAQYCKKNNITAEQIKNGKAIAPAREYAIKEAQKATYRDTNAFSQMVSGWGRKGKPGDNIIKKSFNTVVEGILPFRKTPANILARGVEYSPLWLLKGLSYDLVQAAKGKMSAIEVIDNVSSGLTGTGLMALGVLLAAQGLIRGHGEDDKDEKEFKELMGHQAYALELPNGSSITLDWLAPEALPFFVGVNLWETTKGSDEEANLSNILKSISHISEPMLEMSCLQSLNDLFENIGYASSNDTSGLVSVLASAATSYIMQIIPTLLGQAERTGEETRMATYTGKNMFLTGDMQYTLGKASAKIPFWDYNQIPYIDAWGRKEASGTALKRGLNNFLNPSYTSTINTSDMEKELLRLYETTGNNAVFPSRADKYFTVDGKRKDLTAEEYVKYATLKGEKSYKVITDLVKSKAYKNLSDEEKVKAIDEAYTYADQKAKRAVSNYKADSWVGKADGFGSNVGNYLSFRADVSETREENGGKISKQEVIDIIVDMAQNDSETWLMYLSMYENESAVYARANGIQGETYMEFLDSLDKADKPTESGKYGTYTQEEAYEAIKNLTGLSKQDKAILWQSVNKNWKSTNNPFR